jgi:hypothetical protein
MPGRMFSDLQHGFPDVVSCSNLDLWWWLILPNRQTSLSKARKEIEMALEALREDHKAVLAAAQQENKVLAAEVKALADS